MPRTKKLKCHSGIEQYIEKALELLRESGGRITDSRKAVLNCIAHTAKPLTAKDVLEEISKGKNKISVDQVSVYRILEALQSHGLVHQVLPSGGYFPCLHRGCQHDAHVIASCTSCETTEEVLLPDSLSSGLLQYIRREFAQTSQAPVIHIQSVCRECSKMRPVP